MNKMNIEFKDEKYLYKYKLDFNNNIYLIERYEYKDNYYELIEIIYSNKKTYYNRKHIEKNVNYNIDINEDETILKNLLMKLINHIGLNSITAILINSFGYDVNHLMKKLKEKKFNTNKEYSILQTNSDNTIVLNILNYNCEYIAKIYISDNTISVEKNTNDTINILKIINKYLEKNNKPYLKIMK